MAEEKKVSKCIAVVESVLSDISKGLVQNASAKLQRLREDSDHLTAEAKRFVSRLEEVESYYICREEKVFNEIGNLGRKESDLSREKSNEEARLEGKRKVLRDNESRLRSAEHNVWNAQREVEKRKREKGDKVAIGALWGGITLGVLTLGIGAPAGAVIGAGVGAAIGDSDVSEAEDKLERCKGDYGRARSAVAKSETRVANMRAQIGDLEKRIEKLKNERHSHHEKVDRIKQAIILLKKSTEFWGLFKQASEDGSHRTALLKRIVDKANEKGDYCILHSGGSKRITTTFIEAVEEMVSLAKKGCSSHVLPIEFSSVIFERNDI
jgi:DNA repair exonuclease SbcCD ATPase subunit